MVEYPGVPICPPAVQGAIATRINSVEPRGLPLRCYQVLGKDIFFEVIIKISDLYYIPQFLVTYFMLRSFNQDPD